MRTSLSQSKSINHSVSPKEATSVASLKATVTLELKKKTINKWELETENDLYFTKPLTYQTESRILYKITDKIGLGISGNYINLLEGYDYTARAVITIKFGEAA